MIKHINRHAHTNTHLLCESGRVDAVELSEAVLQHAEPHGVLHHIHALQLEVVHGVQARYAAGAGLGQPQELLGRRGDGLAGRVIPEGREGTMKKRRARKIISFFFFFF